MKNLMTINFSQILGIVNYYQDNFGHQPSLDEIAQEINISPIEVVHLFNDFANVSPEAFFEYISVQQARQQLGNTPQTLFDSPHTNTHLFNTKTQDSLVEIIKMSTSEVGAELTINYSFSETKFGRVLVASTPKGICYMGFSDDNQKSMTELIHRFSKAVFTEQLDAIQRNALKFFTQDISSMAKIQLHLKGTDFQLKVWQALLRIPMGRLTTYGHLATTIQQPKAARAVGTAIGSNPIAFLIPCHRVIQSSGVFGGYMWGASRKAAIIGWEAAVVNILNDEN